MWLAESYSQVCTAPAIITILRGCYNSHIVASELYLIIIILKKKWSSRAMWSLPVFNWSWTAPRCF